MRVYTVGVVVFSRSQRFRACLCSLPFFFLKTPVKKPGDGRKVTFFEPSPGDENGTSKFGPLSRQLNQCGLCLYGSCVEFSEALVVAAFLYVL